MDAVLHRIATPSPSEPNFNTDSDVVHDDNSHRMEISPSENHLRSKAGLVEGQV